MKESEGLYRSFRFLKKALLGLAVVLIGLLLFGYFFFMRHVDAPKAWTAADRELQGGMLQRIVCGMMGAEFGVEIAENPDPYGFGHRRHSKLAMCNWH